MNSAIVIVPDMSAVELTALAERDLKLLYCEPNYERWNFYQSHDGQPIDGRGQKFEALVWKPEFGLGETISSEAVRVYFQERGYFGHAGAFTQWRRQNPALMGYHASIPEDRGCWRDPCGFLWVPSSDFVDGHRVLCQHWVVDDWHARWSFVAFRLVF